MKKDLSNTYKRLRELTGKDYTFTKLQEVIKSSERRKWLLLETALLLHETESDHGDKRPIKLKRLHELFFTHYGEQVEQYINEIWDILLPEKPWIPTGRESEFMEGIGSQVEAGVIGFHSLYSLVRNLKRSCRIAYSESTIYNKLEERLK